MFLCRSDLTIPTRYSATFFLKFVVSVSVRQCVSISIRYERLRIINVTALQHEGADVSFPTSYVSSRSHIIQQLGCGVLVQRELE